MFSPDGKRLIVGDPGVGPTSAWDVDSRTMLSLVPGSPGSFGADGETFVTSDGGQVKVWNVLTGALVSASGNSFTVDYGSIVALSADGRLAAVQEHAHAAGPCDRRRDGRGRDPTHFAAEQRLDPTVPARRPPVHRQR